MRRFRKAVRSFVIRTLYLRRKVPNLRGVQSNSILMIRTDGLGDLLLALPALRHLKESFGSSRISLLTRQEWVDVVRLCPYVDEVIGWDKERYARSISYRLKFIRELRRRKYGVAIHSTYSREPLTDELVCCCLAAQKIGFDGDLNNISPKQKAKNDPHYTRLIKPTGNGNLEIDRNRSFTEEVTGKPIAPADFQPTIWLGEPDRAAAGRLLRNAGLGSERDLVVVLFPGASWDAKLWPFENYAQLADRILQHYDAQIIICGAVTDSQGVARIQANIRGQVFNLAGKTSLRELAAVFEGCDLFIGNDTGPLHLAVSVGIPTLGIIGGGHFGRFYPYGDLNRHRMVHKKLDCYYCNWKCIHESVRCIQEITVEDVWSETQRMIEELVFPEQNIGDKSMQ
jgi:ADP-heptose:LPS heptosyltransferase